MPREVSEAFREAFWSESTDKVAIVMLEIGHSTLATPLRFCLNNEKVRQRPVQTALDGAVAATENDIVVDSAAGLADGDPLTVTLDSGAAHDTTIAAGGISGTTITMSSALPSDAADGNAVAKYLDFSPFPFEIALPRQEAGVETEATLVIDNIDRTISETIRNLTSSPTVKIMIVLADTPDVVELQTPPLRWHSTSINHATVVGKLSGPKIMNSRYPMESFTPSSFPSLFVARG